MILSNIDIQNYVTNHQMISSFEPLSLKNSSYKIRVGEIIVPSTGEFVEGVQKSYVLEPSEIIIVQSKEKFKIPQNITASYSGLFSMSNKGILLINSSMIESGYEGFASCYLVNFSAEKVIIKEDQAIAKINFFELKNNPINPYNEIITDYDYQFKLSENAIKFKKTFLNIQGIEDNVLKNTSTVIQKKITFGGIIIAVLIIFATLEPIISKWIWDKTGLVTTTEKYKLEVVAQDAIKEKKEVELRTSEYQLIQRLSQKVDSLDNVIKRINKKK